MAGAGNLPLTVALCAVDQAAQPAAFPDDFIFCYRCNSSQ
jgi:hypothetical protein